VQIFIGGQNQANSDIKQEVVILEKLENKMKWFLDNIGNMVENGKVLVFVNHIKSCVDLGKIIGEFLPELEFVILHGDKLQYERSNILRRFKKGVGLMIATDVASRGLDIAGIKFVVNYENPKDFETYVHRIGRTGRAGDKDGVAVTCILRKEVSF
jgi:ATP-dependent RNA helicase DDX42